MNVDFPLRGEWLAPNTPGSKIPSHGTNQFGTRYAYDFVQVDWSKKGYPAYKVSLAQYLLSGVELKDYYDWGQPVFAPFDGIVVAVKDGYPENSRTNLVKDMLKARRNARFFDPDRESFMTLAGNHVVIEYDQHTYAALCHLKTGSVKVTEGQRVKSGEHIGDVGHSGNSFAPHLHFQLMDHMDPQKAHGLPCAFREYEQFKNGQWITVMDGIPTNKTRIRKV